jgi:hypothetical protein
MMLTPARARPAALALLVVAGSCAANSQVAMAEPYGDTPAERNFVAEVDQYLLRPRPDDVFILKLGRQACQVRRSGGSSDAAKAAVERTWDGSGYGLATGAQAGSLVHVAVDNLCPEVGYP